MPSSSATTSSFSSPTARPTSTRLTQNPVNDQRASWLPIRADASHHWVSYIEKHHPEVAAKLVADVRVDIDHIDERQVLRLEQTYFGEVP